MISTVRGTRDILPSDVGRWQRLETVARRICRQYGYQEIRTPILEREELFAKGTGEATDIVQKEMYTFVDKSGDRVTLRPEATPSMVRAFVQNSLEQSMPVAKLYSLGPMFRYERPQKGRYRQFYQFDVEAFGIKAPLLDAEIIEMAVSFVAGLGIKDIKLLINSVGCSVCRPLFSEKLTYVLGSRVHELCKDCQRRAKTNPLRIFDCKVPSDQEIIDQLPHSEDHLCGGCRDHFDAVKRMLEVYSLNFQVSHRLVRGLDYYSRTTFEILTQGIGAQNAVLGGGRYDNLVKQLGGPDRAGMGFAAGVDRLILAMPEQEADSTSIDAFVVAIGDEARVSGQVLARDLREAGLQVLIEYEARSLRSQMKYADRLRAAYVLIVGDDELERGNVTIKNMTTAEQSTVSRADVAGVLLSNEK
tara:strand:- start:2205 stop:3455 length:1251 start_codon:yes stop_codon:yes gene_type:complete